MIDVSPHQLDIINAILHKYVPLCEVRAFGSRVTWTAKDYSDLDLIIVDKEKISNKTLSALKDAFGESDLTFRVDVLDWNAISKEFRQVIEKKCEVIQKARNNKISNEWKIMPFSKAVEINPQRPVKKGKLIKFVSMADLKEHNKKIQRFDVRKYTGGSRFRNTDTLMARITPCLENGKTAFVDILEDNEIAGGSTEFTVLSAKKDITISEYVYYLSISPFVRDEAIRAMTGTSGRQRVDGDVFNKLEVRIPNIKEQQKIAKILSDLDAKIELSHQMNKTLEAMAQALFKQWFVDFKFPGYEKVKFVNGLPEDWEEREVTDCGKVVCGKTPPTADKINYGYDIPFITIPDMRNQTFIIKTERMLSVQGSSVQRNKGLPPLSICVSCIATPGLVSITSETSHTNQQINSIVPSKDISPYFLYYTMLNKSEEIKTMGLGGTATLNLNTGNFARIKVVVPANGMMNRFHMMVVPFMEKILVNTKESLSLRAIRDSILPKLMLGAIHV